MPRYYLALLSAPILLIAVFGGATVELEDAENRGFAADTLDPRCEDLDVPARDVVAALRQERDAIGAVKLRDAQFRLWRARKNCHFGFVSVGIQDYVALIAGRYLGYRMRRDTWIGRNFAVTE